MSTSEEVLEGDPESGIRNVPILLVGTKQNEVAPSRRGEVNERAKRMAEVIGAEFINLDTHDPKVLTPGGTTKIGWFFKLKTKNDHFLVISKFFDRAVERAESGNIDYSKSTYHRPTTFQNVTSRTRHKAG